MAETGSRVATVRVDTGDGLMDVYIEEPVGGIRGAQVVLMFPRSGMDGFPQRISAWLAANGHGVVIPDITYRCPEDMPIRDRKEHLKDDEIVHDVSSLLKFLERCDCGLRRPLAIMGHCMGGRHAMLGAGSFSEFEGAIVYYGGDMLEGWGRTISPFDLLPGAKCPLIGFFGGKDKNPSPADVDRLEHRLAELGIRHAIHRYPDVGHAFQQNADRSPEERRAASDSSERTLGFLTALVGSGIER